MIIVNDINTTQFEINGIRYFKNFTPVVRNNFISISNTYGSNITLCEFTHFNQFEVNGVVHASVQETQIALLPILFTRVSLIDIQNTLPDGLLSSGTITVVGQNVNFSTGFNARIQGVLVSNNVQSFLLPLAVESRFDSFGINNLGIIIRIAGDDQENPFLPNIPANVIYITSVLVSSTSVGQPSAPELTGFVQKIYSSVQNVFDVTTFELPSNGSTYFRFVHQNGNLNFNGFTNANNNPELFEGKDFYIENQSDFTLALTTGAGIRPADALTIPARKLAHYKYRGGKLYLVAKSWEDAPQIDFATQAENEQAATATDITTINNTKATTPRGLRWFWNALRAIAWSWSGKQTFWGGVNMGSLTHSRWLRLNGDKDIESFDGQSLLDAKQNNSIYITANTTAVNNDRFIANGTLTVSDIVSPVAGSNYEVVVRGGSVTAGGVAYTNGTTVLRVYNGTDWQTFLYQDNFLEFANTNAFPLTGKKDVIYLALDTKFQYIWNTGLGQYTQITSGTTSVGIDIALVTRPIAMGASLAVGTELGIGTYVYFAVYGTPLGETSAGERTTIVTTSGNQRVTLTVPISPDPTVTYRKIFRTKVNGSVDNQFFTALIADNTTTTFLDKVADASQTGLGLQFYKVNTTSRFFSIGGVQALIADPNLTALGVGAGEQILLSNGASLRTVLIGQNAGRKITTGGFQVIIGNAGIELTIGDQNVVVGNSALANCISGSRSVLMGYQAGRFFLESNMTAMGTDVLRAVTTGDNLVAYGNRAGQFRNDGVELTFLGNGSHYLGAETRASANGVANEQVIGFDARGKGANTVQLGNGNIVDTYLEGRVRLRQYTTATRPAHVVGTVIFDVTLNKMVIGGATDWEVVTSV